jgi:hypothetical protein
MYKSFSLAQLAEGLNRQVVATGNPKMIQKWAATGLLEGLSQLSQERMARMLENQTAEILRNPQMLMEANALSTGAAGLTSSGQIAGFTNVAFPIVRRVFGGLISNNLVSVQPMSLPSGLLFYLDYAYGSNVGGDAGVTLDSASANETYTKGQSVYNNPVGSGVRSGSLAVGGQFNNVGTGFSRVHRQALNLIVATDSVGAWLSGSTWTTSGTGRSVTNSNDFIGLNARWVDFDPKVEIDVENNVFDYCFAFMSASELTSKITGGDLTSLDQLAVTGLGASVGGATNWGVEYQQGTGVKNLRKLNKRGDWNPATGIFTRNELNGSHVLMVLALSNTGAPPTLGNATGNAVTASLVISDSLSVNSDGSALTIPGFESDFGATPSPAIPEVEIKIESVAVTATTRKLRARWSPEMAQDLTAFYSIDVEQELTNIISEMVTLDIDREILNDLISQANAANYYWSRSPGRFVNKNTGTEGLRTGTLAPGPQFTGTVREWYETLMETITDAANVIHKKTLRGSGNFVVCGPEVSTILEHTTAYRANYKLDSDGQVSDQMSIGAESLGTLNGRYTVYRDPYFPVNKILIGLKGSTFLESGYIYAPYVPLLLTPVIYGPEDFTPRKGLMTRYGKKMVRSDFYATVTILDMSII